MKDLQLIKVALISCVWALIGFVAGYTVQQRVIDNYWEIIDSYAERLDAYDQYNRGAEKLLDDINDKYDWVDAFDNYDYYRGRARIDSLMWGE